MTDRNRSLNAYEGEIGEDLEPALIAATKCLGDLRVPDPSDNQDEIISHRFLCRGGICLLVGGTGIGKSTFLMQLIIHLSTGRGSFGINVGGSYTQIGLKVLMVQSENDEGDLAEMRDGIMSCSTELEPRDKETAKCNIQVATLVGIRGAAFIEALTVLAKSCGPFDLVVIDPALSYVEGDTNDAKAVGLFMREQLTRFALERQLAILLVHHTAKPAPVRDGGQTASTLSAYQGAGSSEFANVARAILVLSQDKHGGFVLSAVKRGRRVGWVDAEGRPCLRRRLSQHSGNRVSYWADHGPISEFEKCQKRGPGRKSTLDLGEVLKSVSLDPGLSQSSYKNQLSKALGVSGSTIQNALSELVSKGLLRSERMGTQCRYFLTEEGSRGRNAPP